MVKSFSKAKLNSEIHRAENKIKAELNKAERGINREITKFERQIKKGFQCAATHRTLVEII